MRLDSIWDTEAGKNDYPAVKAELLKKFEVESLYDIRLSSICEDHNVNNRYGTKVYYGRLKEDFFELSPIEVAMICDSGYSFFGGSSAVDSKTGAFKAEIWID